jgi:succinate-acetate transporter protein
MNESIKSIVRHGLSFGGGFLVAKGLVSVDQANELAGAVITVLGVAWSVWKNKKTPPAAPAA